jgi:hypothetical protein
LTYKREKSDSLGTGETGESWRLTLRVRAEKGRKKEVGTIERKELYEVGISERK